MKMAEAIYPDETHVDFRLKGGRDYVHGTDIYTAIEDALVRGIALPSSEITGFRLAIRKPSNSHCNLEISPALSRKGKPDSAVVAFQFSCAEQSYEGWLSETDCPVSERYEYSEESVLDGCTVNENMISLANCADYAPIEKVVAATKLLHTQRFPDARGKWFFSRLDLERLLPRKTDLELTITLNQSLGKRLTRSDIKIDKQSIGSIYFSLVTA